MQSMVIPPNDPNAPIPLRLREIDRYFAATLERLEGINTPFLRQAAMLVSALVGEGHVCADLKRYAGQPLFTDSSVCAPLLDEWCDALRTCSVVGAPGEVAPLILDDEARLYLARYWHLEAQLAVQLLQRLSLPSESVDTSAAAALLERLFDSTLSPDWQHVAAALALRSRVCVISGGPGTGKTTTVTRLLAVLQDQALRASAKPLRIALVAPTGKAAARLGESIGQARVSLEGVLSPEVIAAIPARAQTVHRLLGARPGRIGFLHDAHNPLHLDLLLVDEASMVDLALMSRLFSALPTQARVVLLGDRDQLASVEAGSVLADICARLDTVPGYSPTCVADLRRLGCGEVEVLPDAPLLRDALVELKVSYRFDAASSVGSLARAVNAGDVSAVRELLQHGQDEQLGWREVDEDALPTALAQVVRSGYHAALRTREPLEALTALDRLRILCALREGPFGVVEINRLVEQLLARAGLIQPVGRWYAGRPLLITRNDHRLGLANGDIGIVLPDAQADGRLRAFFRTPDGGVRGLLPERLPEHETVFAMTVHKSQGSEFEHTLLILPERYSPLLTRELVYTAITRARRRIDIWGASVLLEQAVCNKVVRNSGLQAALWDRPRAHFSA